MLDNSVQNEVKWMPSAVGPVGGNIWNGEECSLGIRRWTNGKYYHRIDGPAVIARLTGKSWYLDGIEYTFEDWKIEVRKYYDTQEDYLLMLLKLD